MDSSSLTRRFRQGLARLLGREPRPEEVPDIPVPDGAPVASLIADLGLVEDSTPVRERAGWRRPGLVLVTNVSPARLQWLREAAPRVELVPFDRAEQALSAAPRADAIIGWHTPEIIARAPQLRWIQVQTAGVENAIANPEIRRRDILVTSLKRVASPVIAEHVLAMMLSASRRLEHFSHLQRQRRWAGDRVAPDELGVLRGATLVVTGLGGIGSRVSKLAAAFGMHAIGVRAGANPSTAFSRRPLATAELASAVSEADFVVNALPLTDDTRRVFDAAMFDRFKRGATFVNVGRGETVATDALVLALRSGRVGAAALDVTDPEPLPRSHPLWRMPQVVLTPHVAGVSARTAQWGWQIVRENLRRYAAGERMLSVVDLQRGY